MARLAYLELPVGDAAVTSDFYARAFGWTFTPFGPTYASTMTGDTDIGLQADPAERTAAPLPVIAVDNLDAALAAVTAAGGMITKPVFGFPAAVGFTSVIPRAMNSQRCRSSEPSSGCLAATVG